MNLHDLKPAQGARKSRKRVGRGPGSGHGKTATRGENGQKSRSGYSSKRGFEGGQMPLHRRLPKRGFTNIFAKHFRTVNVDRLNVFESGTVVTTEEMEKTGLLKKGKDPVKVLGNGDVKVALTVQAYGFSVAAAKKIADAGGKAEPQKPPKLQKPRKLQKRKTS
jgi:large subunit ribosomal protein L15